jgi:predicted RNase H-like HicB family nuclease
MARKSLKKKIYQFTAIFEKNEDGGYTVTVPSLPGLVTEGKNLEEAKKMVEDAIRCYLEGLKKEKIKIPEEKEIGQFRVEVKI